MFDEKILDKAGRVIDACREAGLLMVTAESCTGGLLTGALTAIPGSSDVVDRGYITYSLHGKIEMIGVPAQLLAEHGAVSEAVARAMAGGALARSSPRAQLAVAITGVAGPGGTSPTKPAGLVYFAAAQEGKGILEERREFGDIGRERVRLASVEAALDLILRRLE
ncbi:MAG: CinA family protein [Proteobacteria bacterium]|nr:CinA family protein [Pseudomonadota bacterium]